MERRSRLLNAVYEAERLHELFDTATKADAGIGRIDVFAMAAHLEIPVIFRPLEKLLGAYVDSPERGILVTSRRPLSVQRFTAAHELGHAMLNHRMSLDNEEVLSRALFTSDTSFDIREVQANAFASQLLSPPWLIAYHMRRQGWSRQSLSEPRFVYQLALRMGSSFSAACYALEQASVIDRKVRDELLGARPRDIKEQILAPDTRENWYGDVWLITDRDHGTMVEGSRTDTLVLCLKEHSSAGYVWDVGEISEAGLTIRADRRVSEEAQKLKIGGPTTRRLVVEPINETGALGRLQLSQSRPWESDGQGLEQFELEVELHGPIPNGLSPAQQASLLEVA